ncbi:hypothetical protein LTR91_022202 [Friedmanniomyces endolithicus]|uniref:Uncharacterized protein n=1 Tax=Friedmanniomyces endolithicus TaxID=329885 RepID=A0AAN6H909_9PEZI|nr:hypothetical protein LTR91_022202 [Friedmanniomyces endolithicus]
MAAPSQDHHLLDDAPLLPKTSSLPCDAARELRTLAVSQAAGESVIRAEYRPFLLCDEIVRNDWVSRLEIDTVSKLAKADLFRTGNERLRVLALIDSLRARTFSSLLAYECARILSRLGCDPTHPRPLDAYVQDPHQSSKPKAYTQFTDPSDPADADAYLKAEGGSRLLPSGNRDRVVDCMEEFVKYTILMRQHFDLFNDRYSERAERESKITAVMPPKGATIRQPHQR